MSGELTVIDDSINILASDAANEFSTFMLAGQLIGIPVLDVQDILNPMPLTKIPLSGTEIAGLLNLRGRIVTAIDMRSRLNLPKLEDEKDRMSIVVERNEELYSLLVDSVKDVVNIPPSKYEPNPANLEATWADVSNGVYRLEKQIMIVLDITKLLEYGLESE